MAKAALDRLGLTPEVADVLDPSILLLPQVGQGVLPELNCAQDENLKRSSPRNRLHVDTHRAVLAERAFLHELGSVVIYQLQQMLLYPETIFHSRLPFLQSMVNLF